MYIIVTQAYIHKHTSVCVRVSYICFALRMFCVCTLVYIERVLRMLYVLTSANLCVRTFKFYKSSVEIYK